MFNLKLVLEYVLKLIDKLSGRIVVAADHGEGFGEPLNTWIGINIGIYGHIPEIPHEVLIKVPWLIVEKRAKPREKAKGIDYIRTMIKSRRFSSP